MADRIFETGNQIEERKGALQSLSKNYHKPEMSKKQFEELQKKMEEAKNANRRRRLQRRLIKLTSTAAAFLAVFIILPNVSSSIAYAMEQVPVIRSIVKAVTFRNYEYEDTRHKAEINVAELTVEQLTSDTRLQKKLERTIDRINAEIKEITNEVQAQFEESLQEEAGYRDVIVKNEVLNTTKDYFTLKVTCYEGSGSGYERNYYYTIDLNTGQRLHLRDIFEENTDYLVRISDNIKTQMKQQMKTDEDKIYWLDSGYDEWNFKTITNKTAFYINEANDIVICFDEGEVGPMSMGTVAFEIPSEVVRDIRK